MRMIKIRAMIDRSLFGGCTAKDFWSPGVEVGIEVNNGDGSVGFVDRAKERKGDGVIAAEGNDARKGLFLERGPRGRGSGEGWAHEESVVAVFNLLDGVGIVIAVT